MPDFFYDEGNFLLVIGDFGAAFLDPAADVLAIEIAAGVTDAEDVLRLVRDWGDPHLVINTASDPASISMSGDWSVTVSDESGQAPLRLEDEVSDGFTDLIAAPGSVIEVVSGGPRIRDFSWPLRGGVARAGSVRITGLAVAEARSEPEQPTEPEPVPEPELPAEPEASAYDPFATAVDDAGEGRLDALFGRTIPGLRIEDAAVRDLPDSPLPSMIQPPPAAIEAEPVEGDAVDSVVEPSPAPVTFDPLETLAPVAEDDGLHDGRTMSREEFALLRAQRGPVPSTGMDRTERPRVTLSLPSGERIDMTSTILFGRRPKARSIGSGVDPQLIVIDNPYVSGTHAELRFDGPEVVVTDFSTNGTLITKPGVPTLSLISGQPTGVVDGTTLQLTDGVTVSIAIEV